MVRAAQAFIDKCDSEGIKHNDPRDLNSGKTNVTLGVNGSAGNHYDIRFIFDTDNKGAAVRVFGFVKADAEKRAALLIKCNELNVRYRWVKFCIDKDLDLNIECDAVINIDSAGDVCVDLFRHIMSIARDAYPEFMRIFSC